MIGNPRRLEILATLVIIRQIADDEGSAFVVSLKGIPS